jgi:hypothetical protein
VPKKKLEVKINKQEILKSLILRHLMPTSRRHVLLFEFLLPLPIERRNIKYFVPLLITDLKHQLHLEDIDFESMTNNRHEYHSTFSFVP